MTIKPIYFICSILATSGLSIIATLHSIAGARQTAMMEDRDDVCLIVARSARVELARRNVENKTIVIDYYVNKTHLRHIAVIYTLEDGSLASYEISKGSTVLGFHKSWDALEVAKSIPCEKGAVVLQAAWVDGLTFNDLEWTRNTEIGGTRK